MELRQDQDGADLAMSCCRNAVWIIAAGGMLVMSLVGAWVMWGGMQ